MKAQMNNDKFSVLMSIYYKEDPQFLELCMQSVLENQTLLPNEIVMVKDGPLTKELEEILTKYNQNYPGVFKFVPLETNQGLGNALQIGLKECSNELVMRMDTDDICVPNRFETQVNYMLKHTDVAAIGGNIKEFKNSLDEELRLKEMPITYEEILKYSKFRNPLNHMTVCFRKSDILEVGNYEPLFYLEDQYLWSRLLVNKKRIENLNEVLVYARIGNGFEERRGNKNYIKSWKILQNYLYHHNFINYFEKLRNLICMYGFIYAPKSVRRLFYKKLLRKEN